MSRTVKRRPFRGLFGGLVLGFGVALLLIVYGILALNMWYLLGVVVAGALVGLLLAYVAPARTRRTG